MKLSIITICLNNLQELKRTVESVTSQTYNGYEYIVIDGGSTDGCTEYIKETDRIDLYVSEPDKGIYNAMNKGIKMAHGEYCLFMNSGDTLYNNEVLQKAIPHLTEGDFYVGHSILNDNGVTSLRKTPKKMTAKFLLETSIMHQSTFIRTSLLKHKPYNESHKIVSDWEYFFYEWIFNNKQYVPLDMIVSVFYLGGISNNEKSLRQNEKERKDVINKLLPQRIQNELLQKEQAAIKEKSKIEIKIKKALSKPPIQRDWKLLRNSFKFLLQDCWHSAFKRQKK